MHRKVNVLTFSVDVKDGAGKLAGAFTVVSNFITRAEELGYDMKWYCVLPHRKTAGAQDLSAFPGDCEVVTSGDLDAGWTPRECDETIVYAGNWIPQRTDWRTYKEDPSWITTNLGRQVDLLKRVPGHKIFVNTCHSMLISERATWKEFPWLADLYDEIVTFGPGDEIMRLFDRIDGSAKDSRIRSKVRYIQHNTITEKDMTHPEWTPVEDKNMLQFYWQGRAEATCKGMKLWIDFKERAKEHGMDFNVMFNGVMSSIGNVNQLTITMKPKKVFFPFIEFHGRNYEHIEFSDEIEGKTIVHGAYRRADGLKLLQSAGFAMYTTKFPASTQFWPEYTTLEAIQQGTVLAVPSNYFDADGTFPGGDPEELALLPLPMDRTRLFTKKELATMDDEELERLRKMEEDDWPRFKRLYDRLTSDPKYYDEWRERAWKTHVHDVDWDSRVRMLIEGGTEVTEEDFPLEFGDGTGDAKGKTNLFDLLGSQR